MEGAGYNTYIGPWGNEVDRVTHRLRKIQKMK
jgi:hypothetical protein